MSRPSKSFALQPALHARLLRRRNRQVDGNELGGDVTAGRELHRVEVLVLLVGRRGRRRLLEDRGLVDDERLEVERLGRDRPARLLQGLVHVVDGEVVARLARLAVAVVLVGDLLQLLEVRIHTLEIDLHRADRPRPRPPLRRQRRPWFGQRRRLRCRRLRRVRGPSTARRRFLTSRKACLPLGGERGSLPRANNLGAPTRPGSLSFRRYVRPLHAHEPGPDATARAIRHPRVGRGRGRATVQHRANRSRARGTGDGAWGPGAREDCAGAWFRAGGPRRRAGAR